jgi:hypothetical protein
MRYPELSDCAKPWLGFNNVLIGEYLLLQAITCKGLKEW